MPIGGIISSIINAADPGRDGKRYQKQALKGLQDISLPEYEKYIAPYLQQVGELSPETYDVDERGEFRGIDEDPYAERSQLRNLGRLEDIAQEGLPLVDRLRVQEAQRGLANEGSRAREAVLSNLRRRGRAGGGSELAAKLATAGAQEEAARGRGSDIAMQSTLARQAGIRDLGSALGDFRGQNINKEAQLSDMRNRYNQYFSGLGTTAAMNAARARNDAQLYNLGERQRIADQNLSNQYQATRDRNQTAGQGFQDAMTKQNAITNVFRDLTQTADARQAQKQARVSQAGAGVDSLTNTVVGGLI